MQMLSNYQVSGCNAREEKGMDYFALTIAGLGGQGALVIGRLLAEAGMSKYNHVSYFPNYSAAMRGGESECTIILSNEEISSPAWLEPSSLILMGPAPLEEFEQRAKPGGLVMIDSSLVTKQVSRKDVEVFYIPASKTATELGDSRVANFVFLGAYLKATEAVSLELIEEALEKRLAGGKWDALLSLDKRALREGARLVERRQGVN